jgi:hypothetical protein
LRTLTRPSSTASRYARLPDTRVRHREALWVAGRINDEVQTRRATQRACLCRDRRLRTRDQLTADGDRTGADRVRSGLISSECHPSRHAAARGGMSRIAPHAVQNLTA